jgi:hypothetical protein
MVDDRRRRLCLSSQLDATRRVLRGLLWRSASAAHIDSKHCSLVMSFVCLLLGVHNPSGLEVAPLQPAWQGNTL